MTLATHPWSLMVPGCFQMLSISLLQELPDAANMEALTASWQPYRSIGSWYMWRLVEAEGKRTPKKPAKRPVKAVPVPVS